MAEIKLIGRYTYYFLVFLLFTPALFSQGSKVTKRARIELINADTDKISKDQKTGKELHRLLGNVRLKHNEITLTCDSAHFWPDSNQITAYKNIHIEQGDTLDLYGQYLFYDGRTEIANLRDSVELIDKETHLFTDAVDYDVKNEIATYTDKGRIINGDNTLTSIIGIYYVAENLFHFKDSVIIVNPDYVMTADTMDYNTQTETSIFTGPTELKGDSIYIYSERGWHDTKNEISRIWQNALIDNRQQIIKGDSLYYDSKAGYGQSFGNISIADTTNSLIVLGNYAWYYKEPERFMVTDSAVFIQHASGDSLFLHADTIRAHTVADTSAKGYRVMRAYYGCRIFSKDLQAKCDSLSYSFRDSVIRFYEKPIIWSAENQLTSDSMALFTRNRQSDRLELYNAAFIVSKVDTMRYNQIKGRSLTGYFKENELYKIDVTGNAESIYFLLDGPRVAGVNTGKCARIQIFIADGKITDIVQYEAPEGVIDPPGSSSLKPSRLEGFNWFEDLRPGSMEDIFIKKTGP